MHARPSPYVSTSPAKVEVPSVPLRLPPLCAYLGRVLPAAVGVNSDVRIFKHVVTLPTCGGLTICVTLCRMTTELSICVLAIVR